MKALDAILNKGGAGKSLSREATVDYLNPLLQKHNELIMAYESALDTLEDRALAELLDDLQPRNRTDIMKMDEMVYSNGGTPPSGTDLDPEDFDLGSTDTERLGTLLTMEEAYHKMLETEYERRDPLPHDFRTKATLENVIKGSDARLDSLEGFKYTV